MNDEGSSRGGSRMQSAPNGKYYPSVDELVNANNEEFRALTEKLNKDWILCLLKDTVTHLRQAKSFSTILNGINTEITAINTSINERASSESSDKIVAELPLMMQKKLSNSSWIEKNQF